MLSNSIHEMMCALTVFIHNGTLGLRFLLAFVSHIYDTDFGFHYHHVRVVVGFYLFIFRLCCITFYAQVLSSFFLKKKRLIWEPFIIFYLIVSRACVE